MKPIWLKYYPQVVSTEVDIFRYASLMDTLEQSSEHFRKLSVFTNLGIGI